LINSMNRRQFIAISAATAASTATVSCSGRSSERPEGVPVGPFGHDSTAEEVSAGLDLTGKTALVTGSNSGIGYETARVLALRGAHVICAARTVEKAQTTSDSIAGDTSPSVFDLADWGSIGDAAAIIRATGKPIDILVLNAGIMELPDLQQVYGLERQFVVNHLGHFILVNQLFEQIITAPQGRIVSVSSGAATRLAPDLGIHFEDLSGETWYDPGEAYGHSKLANALLCVELTQRFKDTAATANSLRPGVIATNLGRHMPRWKTLALEIAFRTVGSLLIKNVGQGAATSVYVGTAPALAATSGQFFDDCNPVIGGGYIHNKEMATKLWTISEELTQNFLI
jgi:NAD(P)-dependent dehydrogenase (short-subunit alcohol dehydrogenase family)